MASSLNGTGITFSNGSTQSVAAVSTSLVAGNGIAVSGATGAVTVSVAPPTGNTIGSYASAGTGSNASGTYTFGSNYAAGTGNNQIQAATGQGGSQGGCAYVFTVAWSSSLSGTWKWLGATVGYGPGGQPLGLAVRVA